MFFGFFCEFLKTINFIPSNAVILCFGKIYSFEAEYLYGRIEKVLNSKEKFTGCTVHYVTSRLDSGNIIMQKKIKVSENETEYSLKKRVLIQEHKLYPRSIISIFK